MSGLDVTVAVLIDRLWDRADPQVSEANFREALRLDDLDDDGRVELATQLVRALVLQQQFAEAMALLHEIGVGINERSLRARVRWQLERGRALASAIHSDDPVAALIHYEAAWMLAGKGAGADDLGVDAAHMACIVAVDPDEKARWLDAALDLASTSTDPAAQRWRASLRNNLGMAQHEAGDDEAALDSFREAMVCRIVDGASAADIFVAEWMVAWALRLTGDHEAALAVLWRLEAEGTERGDPDPYVFEELGENLQALGRHDQAAVWLERAGRT